LSRVLIFSYNQFSEGAKELSHATGFRRIKHTGSHYTPKNGDKIINWGAGTGKFPGNLPQPWNRPELVTRASNKLAFFQHLQQQDEFNVRTPDWTTDPVQTKSWIEQGHIVVARGVLSGHSGAGISILENGVDFVTAPLYTKYVKKESEWRVHCAFDMVIDLQRKIKRPDFEGVPNWRVRNHQNGFIYVRHNIQPPEEVKTQALEAFKASGLHFGAVDVLWNAHEARAYVLEINTAPGITGTTVERYKVAFTQAASSVS
jgi:hypothetical protein